MDELNIAHIVKIDVRSGAPTVRIMQKRHKQSPKKLAVAVGKKGQRPSEVFTDALERVPEHLRAKVGK